MRRPLDVFRGYRGALTWNVAWFSASSAVLGVASAFYSWLLPLLAYREGTQGLVAWAFSAAYAAAALMSLAGGVMADSLGRRAAVLLFTAMYPPAFAAALAGGSGIAAAALLISTASNAARPAAAALVGESVPHDKVGRAFSLWTLSGTAGYAVGSAALGYVASLDVRGAITLCLAASLAALAMRLPLRETSAKASKAEWKRAAAVLKAASSSLARRNMGRLLLASSTVSGIGGGVLNAYLAVFLGKLGVSELEIGLIYSVSTAVSAVVTPMAGVVVDRPGGFPSLIASSMAGSLLVVALALLPQLGPQWAFPLVLALWVISAVNSVASGRWTVEVTRQETRGTVSSALSLVSYAGQAVGPAYGALLWGISPSAALLGAVAVELASLAPFAAAWRLWRRGERL